MEQFEGITFNYNDQDLEIPFAHIEELLKFRNMKPVVCVGITGGGKTTLAIDVLAKFAKQANNVYFITQTTKSYTDTAMSKIPSYFIKEPGDDPFTLISGIWDDIEARVKAISIEPDSVKTILSALYPGKDVNSQLESYISSLGIVDPHDQNAVRIEILTRLILDKVNQDESVLTRFDKPTRMKINGLITNTTKSILILDDVTGMLSSLTNAREPVIYDGVSQTKSKAFISLLRNMLTRGRHTNCIIMMFIHDINVLGDTVVKSLDNLIIMDASSATTIAGKTSLGKDVCEYLKFAMKKTDIFNPNRFKYYSMFLSRSNRQIYITKADLHDHIDISPARAQYHRIMDRIIAGNQNPSLAPVQKEIPEEPLVMATSSPASERSPSPQSYDADGDVVLSMGLDDFQF